jgi:hypothetical protein
VRLLDEIDGVRAIIRWQPAAKIAAFYLIAQLSACCPSLLIRR